MKKKIDLIIQKIENLTRSPRDLILLFLTIIFVRTFFENFTNNYNWGFFNGPVDTFIFYPLWCTALVMSIGLLLYVMTRQPLWKIANIVVVSFCGVFIVPIADFIMYGFLGYHDNAITGNYTELWHHFTTLTFSSQSFGLGMKLETLLAIIGVGIYVYFRTKHKHIAKTLLSMFFGYIVLFFFLSITTHFIHLINALSDSGSQITAQYFLQTKSFIQSIDMQVREYTYFSRKVSIALVFIIISILGIVLVIKNKFIDLMKHMRWEHIAHVCAFLLLGIFTGFISNTSETPADFFIVLNIIALFTSVILACFFIVCENDEADIEGDKLTRSRQLLISSGITDTQRGYFKKIVLTLSILLAGLVNYTALTMVILFILMYHHYSKPPLRIKQLPIVSSFVLTVNILFIFIAGFFTTNYSFNLAELPFSFMLGIFVIYFLTENIRNMKDIKGDKATDVTTLPVLLKNKAGVGMSILFVTAIIFSILYFTPSNDITFALLIGTPIIIYFLNKKPYTDKPLFVIYFVFAIFLLLRLWLF